MTDRPIIFSGPMVRALLDGRKTQTRRIIKMNGLLPEYGGPSGCQDDPSCWGWEDADHGDWITLRREPGQRMGWLDWRGAFAPGDRLFVREAHYLTDDGDEECVVYAADHSAVDAHLAGVRNMQRQHNLTDAWAKPHLKLRPSIHMPRWASRLTLIVTDVRVQRLQDISEADAVAEGVGRLIGSKGPNYFTREISGKWTGSFNAPTAQEVFADLWDSFHGLDAWDANPWVCALTFTVHHANIDEVTQ